MVKPSLNKGFTLIEMLFVLMIVMTFSIYVAIPKDNLNIFMNEMLMHCIICQEKAFFQKDKKEVQIQYKDAYFDGIHFVYPKDITCTSQSFHYNEKANISKACSFECTNGISNKKIVFQLGSGRGRIDE